MEAWTSLVFTLMIPATMEPRTMPSFPLMIQHPRFSWSELEKTSKLLAKSEIYSDKTASHP